MPISADAAARTSARQIRGGRRRLFRLQTAELLRHFPQKMGIKTAIEAGFALLYACMHTHGKVYGHVRRSAMCAELRGRWSVGAVVYKDCIREKCLKSSQYELFLSKHVQTACKPVIATIQQRDRAGRY
ncbi:MAG: hypothetical protein ACOH2J_14755 [Allorhizobium sp.]